MKTNYKSIPVIASVIGSVTRKAMYITHVTSINGETIYHDTWIPVSWLDNKSKEKQFIEWENHSQSLVQFPISKATKSMIIDENNIIRRMVDNKATSYMELTERFVLYLPFWFFTEKKVINDTGMEETIDPILKTKFKKTTSEEEQNELFNDDEFFSIIEEKAAHKTEGLRNYLTDRAENTFGLQFYEETDRSSIQQWELDNPEYQSYN